MGNKVTDGLILAVRSVLGGEFSDIDIIRALHMANNDITAAINIILDTPRISARGTATPRSKSGDGSANPLPRRNPAVDESSKSSPLRNPAVHSSPSEFFLSSSPNSQKKITVAVGIGENEDSERVTIDEDDVVVVLISEKEKKSSSSVGSDWWFVGSAELAGLSTCKGRRLMPGDEVMFSFPSEKHPSLAKLAGRGRSVAAASEIVRFSTKETGEVSEFAFILLSLNCGLLVCLIVWLCVF